VDIRISWREAGDELLKLDSENRLVCDVWRRVQVMDPEEQFTRRERRFLSKKERKWERFVLYLLLGISLVTGSAFLFTLIWTRHFADDDLIGVLFWVAIILFISDRLFLTRLVRKLARQLNVGDPSQMEK